VPTAKKYISNKYIRTIPSCWTHKLFKQVLITTVSNNAKTACEYIALDVCQVKVAPVELNFFPQLCWQCGKYTSFSVIYVQLLNEKKKKALTI